MSKLDAPELLDNLARLVAEGASTRTLEKRREKLRDIRAKSVERARQIEAEQRSKDPKLDEALSNLERFHADAPRNRTDRDLTRNRSYSPVSKERRRTVTFADVTPKASSSSSSDSDLSGKKKSIGATLKHFFLGSPKPRKLYQPDNFHAYRSPNNDPEESSADSQDVSSADSAEVSSSSATVHIRPSSLDRAVQRGQLRDIIQDIAVPQLDLEAVVRPEGRDVVE